jgi:hypothetical protein
MHENKKNPAIIADSGVLNGEPAGARTLDPLIKSQMLYRLSYRPEKRAFQQGIARRLSREGAHVLHNHS